MTITRRDFLKSSAAATVTLLAPVVSRAAAPAPSRALVIVQLAGGNDSLNTLVPFTDARYRAFRPALALPERDLLPIADDFAFHPSLAPLVPLFEKTRLALMDGTGFPSLDRSHFRSQDVWQTADEGAGRDHRRRSGWIARYAEQYLSAPHAPLLNVAIGDRAPLGMTSSDEPPAVIAELSRFVLPADDTLAVLRDLYGIRRDGDALTEAIRAYGAGFFAAADAHAAKPVRDASVVYPDSRLGHALRAVASILHAHPETHVAWVTTGGYDTHAKQAGDHAALLSDLASSLAAFQSDLQNRAIDDRVLLMAWSEFGRRVAENASAGTDHGKAGLVFVMGSAVRGGLWGERPDLGRLDGGDLPVRIDFRSVYATLIRRWFGRDPEPVLGHAYPISAFLGA